MRLHDGVTPWRLALNPDLAFGEAWMDGRITVEDCSLHDLLAVLSINIDALPPSCWETLRERAVAVLSGAGGNTLARSRRNVAHHYDLTDRFYELFLDRDKQYSCAYFHALGETLERAQDNKKRHIAGKLGIAPGMRVLDIGCGWGGLALYLARECGADVTGITLSETQLAAANARLAGSGLEDRVRFVLTDYRAVRETFDRVVSVGMFEHVGVGHYPEFFARVRALLAPGGVALLHSIGRADGPGVTNAWLEKYIFPGGYAPALSEVLPTIERAGLWATDIEILRLHYAETLAHWHTRFQANRAEAATLTDERFCRLWEFYLAGAEMDFRHQRTMVFQIQLAREIDAVPLVRDYMVDWERAHGGAPGPVPFAEGRRKEKATAEQIAVEGA
ncbi:MAG TPA: cyclopropane-fatty-acyl-phospholipid synthase family protein [Alphaproteobacteria bacterium]|nr:cyclopropane-fatty-acyl-phospholipid synthase family protein [Alphaproteobacteria bacterium]